MVFKRGGNNMGYCFMSIEKIKEKGTMTRKYEHNYRTGYVPNADAEKASLNEELVSLKGKTYVEAFNERMEKLKKYNPKIRKNAVLGLEIVTTFSREDREIVDIEQWKKDQVTWLEDTFNANKEKYGNNVLSVMYHGDEAGNVHCHAMIIPIDENGRLNASYYLDGRKKIIELQDSYGAKMSKNHGLRRGLKNSSAKHEDIKRYYAALNQALAHEAPPVQKVNGHNETAEEYKVRVDELIKDLNLKILAEQKKAERAIDEIKTLNMDEKFTLYKQVEQAKKVLGISEDEDLDLETIYSKAQTMDTLNKGIQNYPDKQEAAQIFKSIQKMIQFQTEQENLLKEEERKKKKKDKNQEDIKS